MRKFVVALAIFTIAACAAAEQTNIVGFAGISQSLTYQFTDDLGQQTDQNLGTNKTFKVTFGQTTNQMNIIWSGRITLTEGATRTLDLAGGLTNRFGKPITFTGVKWLQVNVAGQNSGTVRMGDEIAHWATFLGGTNQSVALLPDVGFQLICPGTNIYTVTAATGDLLKFENEAPAYTNIIDVFIGGIGN